MQDAVINKVLRLISAADPNFDIGEIDLTIIRNIRRNGNDINAWCNLGVNDSYIFSKVTISELYRNLNKIEVYRHAPRLAHEFGWEVDLPRKDIK